MQVRANGITIEVEEHGSPQGEPLMLIMGLGMQLVAWHEDFVQMLVDRGFRVIRFDNRDIGLSENLDRLGVPNIALESVKHVLGLPARSPYSLGDMAKDAAGVLDALGIARAHVCGASMGGMIAQHLAARHAQRVASVTLMMTTSGARRLPGPSMRMRAALVSRPKDPKSFESILAHYVKLYEMIGSPAYPPDEEWLRRRLTMSIRRSYRPRGVARQLAAIVADGDRTPLLAEIHRPTQIIHGLADPLVPVEAGRDLASRIPDARADLIEGMGHDLPLALWPRFVADIATAASRA